MAIYKIRAIQRMDNILKHVLYRMVCDLKCSILFIFYEELQCLITFYDKPELLKNYNL